MPNKPDYSLAILISGNGSNLQAILDAITHHKLPAKISVVLSDRADAFGLERAKKAGIETVVLNPKNYASRADFDQALESTLETYAPNLVVLAGFMRILGKNFVQYFKNRLINIHPALLPAHKGLNTYQNVLAAGDKEQGATVHFVTEALDGGPIIAQNKFTITASDTLESLKNRTQTLEHILYPEVIRWFSEEKLQVLADGIYLNGKKIPPTGILLDGYIRI
jgi:phosphoribosylglycinamide formyltransferase 1